LLQVTEIRFVPSIKPVLYHTAVSRSALIPPCHMHPFLAQIPFPFDTKSQTTKSPFSRRSSSLS